MRIWNRGAIGIARSLVAVLVLTLMQTIVLPVVSTQVSPQASAADANDLPTGLGTVYQFLAESYTSGSTTWAEARGGLVATISNSATKVTNTAGTFGASKAVVAVQGTVNTVLTFPATIGPGTSSDYTFLYVARYAPIAGSAYQAGNYCDTNTHNAGTDGKSRIFTSGTGNWLSGFWACAAGVAFHEGWVTDNANSVTELRSSNDNNWLLGTDCGYTAVSTSGCKGRFRAFGTDRTVTPSISTGVHQVGVHIGTYGGEQSDYQIAEVITYPTILPVADIVKVETYLARKYGITLSASSATKLGIHRSSVGTNLNEPLSIQPQIAIQDANGQTVTTDNLTQITATVTGLSGRVIGSATATAIAGVATFENFGIDGIANNSYTITYSSNTGLTTTNEVRTFTRGGGSETDTALSLNGSNQYAEFTEAGTSPLDLTGTLTLSAWVKPNTSCSSSGTILTKRAYMVYCSGGFWYWMLLADGMNGAGVSTAIPVEANEWHHLAFTKLSSSGNLLFYYDGVLVKTITSGVTTIGTNDQPFSIGRYGTSMYFDGQIDEVRIFNTQRSQAQIQSDMSSYGSITESGLVAYYDFNELTTPKIFNREIGSTTATDLTIYNSPTLEDVKIVDPLTLSGYTITKFPRSYLNSYGGWKVPANVTNVSALTIGGGGAGGSRVGGGGGAGGYVYRGKVTLSSGGIETITVGVGGLGKANYAGGDGTNSIFGSRMIAIGGGGGGVANSYGGRAGRAGGSGGGTGDASGVGATTQVSTGSADGFGNAGGVGQGGGNWSAGGGGGAGSTGYSGIDGSKPGFGGDGKLDPVGGSNLCLAAGGGGGVYGASGATRSNPGACASGTTTSGSGTAGQLIGFSAAANSGSGGGGAGYVNAAEGSDVAGGSGGSGVIIVRWITATKPAFTQPKIAYLNAGMSESFSVNMASDSATPNLIRTFRWESSTSGVNGTYRTVKEGTGANNSFFAWTPQNTATTGSTYAYRVVVTDSDTAGLWIQETSNPVWAIINEPLNVSGSSSVGKAINLSKSETYTITLGTSTYRSSLAPVIPGITLDTRTAGFAVIGIADTVTVGTYYETLTVTDSVSAVVNIPLTIQVSAAPTLINSSEVISNDLIFHLDAGNSQSMLLGDTATATNVTWADLSGNKKNALTSGTYDTGGFAKACAAPTWSPYFGGSLAFDGATTCYWAPYIDNQLNKNVTVEAWVRLDGTTINNGAMLVQQNYNPASASNLNFLLGDSDANGLIKFGIWDGGAYRQSPGLTLTKGVWTHLVGTYDGSTFKLFKDAGIPYQSAVYTTGLGATINRSGTIIGRRGSSTGSPFFNGSIASVRIYKVALTADQIAQNYNASKDRFSTPNLTTFSQRYGESQQDSFTITSGSGSKTIGFFAGNRSGVNWDTATAGLIKLDIQESLTVNTYSDTVTVTDALGQSTYLSIKISVTKAETITVTLRNPKTLVYTGSPAASLPDIGFIGLKGSDTGTVIRLYSSGASKPGAPETYTALSLSSTTPRDVETYTVTLDTLTLTTGSLSNYLGYVFESSTLTITQANQSRLTVPTYGAFVGGAYPIVVNGGSGGGSITETITAGSTASDCRIENHVLRMSSNFQSYCNLLITKSASRNYFVETATVQINFWYLYVNQPAPEVGTGPNIALSGWTSFTVSTNALPTISSVTASGDMTYPVAITGTGFSASSAANTTVKFWRGVEVSSPDFIIKSDTLIWSKQPIGAAKGRVYVQNGNGTAQSPSDFTPLIFNI